MHQAHMDVCAWSLPDGSLSNFLHHHGDPYKNQQLSYIHNHILPTNMATSKSFWLWIIIYREENILRRYNFSESKGNTSAANPGRFRKRVVAVSGMQQCNPFQNHKPVSRTTVQYSG
jgi:hypothetical protein